MRDRAFYCRGGLIVTSEMRTRPALFSMYNEINMQWQLVPIVTTALLAVCAEAYSGSAGSSEPYGLTMRSEAKAYLLMPTNENGALPMLLSQTGAFEDVRALTPNRGLIPYDLNAHFWSD